MENEENNFLEKTNSKNNNSSINMNNINIENDKNEIMQNITPKLTEIINQKDNINNNFKENNSIHQITNEEYNTYKEKKIKLYNFYQTLLNFRQKLIIKEKHLNQREKNLLEFEKVLKANESILKNNIEQFESYMRNKIAEIKTQFNQIEQLQINKEQYLKQKEEEIKTENNYTNLISNNNINFKRCSKCNCVLLNEDEMNKQLIKVNNNFCDSCNNYLKKTFRYKEKNMNNMPINNNNFITGEKLAQNNQINNQNSNLGNLNNKFNLNYCLCPGCKFCNI